MTILDKKCRVIATDGGDIIIFVKTNTEKLQFFQDLKKGTWSFSEGHHDENRQYTGYLTLADAVAAACVPSATVATPQLMMDLGLVDLRVNQ